MTNEINMDVLGMNPVVIVVILCAESQKNICILKLGQSLRHLLIESKSEAKNQAHIVKYAVLDRFEILRLGQTFGTYSSRP